MHVVQVTKMQGDDGWNYKLTTTLFVVMLRNDTTSDVSDLSGFLVQQDQQTCKLKPEQSHLEIIGPMMEKLEAKMCGKIEETMFKGTKSIIDGMKSQISTQEMDLTPYMYPFIV